MQGGRILEQGTHEKLMRHGSGAYVQLVHHRLQEPEQAAPTADNDIMPMPEPEGGPSSIAEWGMRRSMAMHMDMAAGRKSMAARKSMAPGRKSVAPERRAAAPGRQSPARRSIFPGALAELPPVHRACKLLNLMRASYKISSNDAVHHLNLEHMCVCSCCCFTSPVLNGKLRGIRETSKSREWCSGGSDVEGGRRLDARSSVLGGAEVAARTLGRMRASAFGAY